MIFQKNAADRMVFTKKQISVFTALLFHISGAAGMLFSPYRDWFISLTPLNLLLMLVLVAWNQPKINTAFLSFFLICFTAGMLAEITGTNTGILFGDYRYGTVMGPGFAGVPWLIGIYWFVVVFGSFSIMQLMQNRVTGWLQRKGETPSATLNALSLVFDGAMLAVFFDWVMEPVAVKLGFWTWTDGSIPFFNYLCWFGLSALLLLVARWFKGLVPNHFAVDLYIIQLLFFITLRIFL
jgi:putative membrane protein